MNPQELKEYFDNATGHGVLATADALGRLNQAVFGRPHVMEDGTAAFIMPQPTHAQKPPGESPRRLSLHGEWAGL